MNINLPIPDDLSRKMKKYKGIKWNEVVKQSILDYIDMLEGGFEMTTKEILEEMGEDFKRSLDELSLEKALEGYESMRDAEWKRISMTQAN